jgi:murein L,D-transpeptidase YafK
MTPENMTRHAGSRWFPFWANLKTGYDMFENTRTPPLVGMDGIRYAFYTRDNLESAVAAQMSAPATAAIGGTVAGTLF